MDFVSAWIGAVAGASVLFCFGGMAVIDEFAKLEKLAREYCDKLDDAEERERVLKEEVEKLKKEIEEAKQFSFFSSILT